MFISSYFNRDFSALGTFDAVMDTDSHYFINITRLKDASTFEFKESYNKVNSYFKNIAILLDNAENKSESDRFYREALKRFDFPEVNGINLGFSTTKYGAAFGTVLSKKIIGDAYDIIKKGIKDPEIFHLVGLFEDNVGPDRLSDMFATIIKDDIYAYTKRINEEIGITPDNFPNETFKNGVVHNSYKNCDLLLLPKEILHELPIARCWDDIDRVMSENKAIRDEINQMVGSGWREYSSCQKKAFLKHYIFEDPDKCQRLLESYRMSHEDECDWEADLGYVAAYIFKDIKKMGFDFLQHSNNLKEVTSQDAIKYISNIFKDWVENNKGWSVILDASDSKREKIVQRLLHLSAKEYIKLNNLDLTFESDLGRGPVDLKISRGLDKSICEIKLSSNSQFLHGYKKQVEEYGKAENTDSMFYMFVDVGHPKRLKSIQEAYQKDLDSGTRCPTLITIDSTPKNSASVKSTDITKEK
ncbi:MAG: hypothetical protein LUH18_08320 [Oscillospiraceae bacterium]|nr:hypothetical protein [Oscillospiraceae bacterium]